jgi:hypothetical protein
MTSQGNRGTLVTWMPNRQTSEVSWERHLSCGFMALRGRQWGGEAGHRVDLASVEEPVRRHEGRRQEDRGCHHMPISVACVARTTP